MGIRHDSGTSGRDPIVRTTTVDGVGWVTGVGVGVAIGLDLI